MSATARELYPDLVLSEAYERGNLLTTYLLEGHGGGQTGAGWPGTRRKRYWTGSNASWCAATRTS